MDRVSLPERNSYARGLREPHRAHKDTSPTTSKRCSRRVYPSFWTSHSIRLAHGAGRLTISGGWLRASTSLSGYSDETCKSRLKARNASGAHPFQTSEEQFDQITRYFVPPEDGEGFNLIIYDAAGKVRYQADF